MDDLRTGAWIPQRGGRGFHRLFEAQAAAEGRPDVAAVEFGDIVLSYAEFNRRANHLAARPSDLSISHSGGWVAC